MSTLYYIHDPMCSWCWGFKPVWTQLKQHLSSNIKVKYLLGGLAKDSDEIMPIELQSTIQQTWKRIQKEIPETQFNFNFWTENKPRRSTYPACRAVIAARKQNKTLEIEFINLIQNGYYLKALNPSDNKMLINAATKLDLDIDLFTRDLSSNNIQKILEDEIVSSRKIGAQGFPSLVLSNKQNLYPIPIDYNNMQAMLNNINIILD